MSEEKIEVFYVNDELSHAYVPSRLAEEIGIKGIFGPSNLKWKKKVNFSKPLEYLSTKSQKRILSALEYAKNDLGILIELNNNILEKDFNEWFLLYQKTMLSKDTGDLRIQSDWYDKKRTEIETYGSIIIRNKNNEIIGGIVLKKLGTSMSCSYRAHEYLRIKDSSLAALLEYFIDVYSIENGFKIIYRGTDSNIYGPRLSKGLLEFKTNYGFTPTALDYSSSYYPRHLVFFKTYPELLTYEYSNNEANGIVLKTYKEEELKQYTYKVSDIFK